MTIRQPTQTYKNHHLNGGNWHDYVPRDDDIVIGTPTKAGTTWTQAIVANLIFPDGLPDAVSTLSPWLEARMLPKEAMLATLEGQTHRRFIKTHLAADGLPIHPTVKYIAVGRDGRDVLMSLWNHYKNYAEGTFKRIRERLIIDGGDGSEFPRAPDSIDEFWREWCTRGWFDGQGDGWPFWSELYIMQSWWELRSEPNVLLMHYSDMLADTRSAVAEIAQFLEIGLSSERLGEVVSTVSFDNMKNNSDTYAPFGGLPWKGGADTFFNKGTNGRWSGVVSEDNLALYDAASTRTLSAGCHAWVENGRAAISNWG
jgi:aryl sulfotransferase